jgi:hypothetical protein
VVPFYTSDCDFYLDSIVERNMPSACATRRRNSKSRKNRKSRKNNRRQNGGFMAPINYANPDSMKLSLGQGKQFAEMHEGQHGGSAVTSGYSPYPGAVTTGSFAASGVSMDSAKQSSLIAAYNEIAGLKDQAGGYKKSKKSKKSSKKSRKSSKSSKSRKSSKKSKKSRKSSKKSRKSSRKNRRQNGGDFVRWGGRRTYNGGSVQNLSNPMTIQDSAKMLISPQMVQQAGLNPEWKLAENPKAFSPN